VEDPQSPTRNSGFFQSLKKRLPVGPGTSPPLRSPPPVYEEQETNGQWPGHAELPAAVPMRALASVPMEMPTEEHARLQGGAGGAGGAGGGSTANGDGLGISELPAQVPSRNEERSRSVLSSMRYESVDNGDGRANRVG